MKTLTVFLALLLCVSVQARTRAEIEAQIRADNPTSDGRGPGDPIYEALITKWTDAAVLQAAVPKGWPSVQQFLDQFSDAELATIASSENSMVKGLLVRLNGWRDVVHADNERIVLGLGLLVQLNLITAERRDAILATATTL